MNITQLKNILKVCFKSHQQGNFTPIFITGGVGVGKTSIIKDVSSQMGYDSQIHLTSQMFPYEVAGLPFTKEVNGEMLSMVAKPTFLNLKTDKTVLIFDEFNMGSPETNSALQSFITERRIGNYKLPSSTILIFLGNDDFSNANTNKLSSPINNRFRHISFEGASTSEYKEYMISKNFNSLIKDFLSLPIHKDIIYYPNSLEKDKRVKFLKENHSFPSPRSWESLSKDLNTAFGQNLENFNNDIDTLETLISINIGDSVKGLLLSFFNEFISLPSIKDIVKNPLLKMDNIKEIEVLNMMSKYANYFLTDDKLDQDIVDASTGTIKNGRVAENIVKFFKRFDKDTLNTFLFKCADIQKTNIKSDNNLLKSQEDLNNVTFIETFKKMGVL